MLLCLCLTPLLVSCATTREPEVRVVKEVQVERVRPPALLMRPCPGPVLAPEATLGDVVRYAIASRQALRACNDQLEALSQSVEADAQ